ncbi:MAG: AAA-like domain-containing protein [Desulfovermiculus sp.]|nr:AAA-like domain-containing protein [Desulfovermiculus sp.]
MRFFNTAGPVNCQDHYCLPPLQRFDLSEIEMLIEQKKYVVLHAPRQTGKTSSMLALQKHLNAGSEYRCLYVNVEGAQAAREDVEAAIQSILAKIDYRYRNIFKDSYLHERWPGVLSQSGAYSAVTEVLGLLASHMQHPLVVILDEIDSLVGDTLIAVLRQLREGYDQRPDHFPQSIMLCGVRDVRDYRIHSSSTKEIITGGSAFNIKAKSLRLGDFIQSEVEELLLQHTRETGQELTPAAKACIWHLSQGQPWLVNALAYETCFEMKEGRDRSLAISKEMVDQAKENLIARRETHLDQLGDKLQEERVQRVVAPMLEGRDLNVRLDDIQYVQDLGLIRDTSQGPQIANPIYAEIIPRELTVSEQANLEARYDQAWYIRSDGSLDMHKLISAFQEFFREHSEVWLERFQYKEAGPQLLMQAFLQRVVNSGGRVEREFGLGRMRTDLLVLWPLSQTQPGQPEWTRWQGPIQKAVIELKILYKSLEKTIEDGLRQTWEYLDRCGTDEGHLIVFDRRDGVSWEEKIFQREESYQGRKITVWGT